MAGVQGQKKALKKFCSFCLSRRYNAKYKLGKYYACAKCKKDIYNYRIYIDKQHYKGDDPLAPYRNVQLKIRGEDSLMV